ncbi:MAG: hypothetical protein GYA35_00875 [Thermoanaerobaculaceae bacterium]|nr:hypothetical protein [Thermoanaerobaculaceae bacterium]
MNQEVMVLCIQTLLLAGAIIFFLVRKGSFIKFDLAGEIKQVFSFFKRHKLFTTTLCIVVISYLFLGYLSILLPQNTSDSLYNHLARIAHWLQQGSLKPYDTFSDFGITYPYNNSLLMMWSMLFIHSDRLVGLVQWFAAILLALAIYGLATELRFPHLQAGFSAVVFLTFPIVIFESITAQNDLLAASFFLIGMYFFIRAFQTQNYPDIVFSALSI